MGSRCQTVVRRAPPIGSCAWRMRNTGMTRINNPEQVQSRQWRQCGSRMGQARLRLGDAWGGPARLPGYGPTPQSGLIPAESLSGPTLTPDLKAGGFDVSKADKIRSMLHLSNAKIAKRVGCLPEYVRVVRQRTSHSGNPIERAIDLAWRPELRARERRRYRTDPAYRKRRLAQAKEWVANNRERRNAYMRDWQAARRAEARAS